MKKLLGILASIGLTTATGSAIIISSNEENQLQNEKEKSNEKVKENDEGIPAKGADVTLTLSETKGGELLTETDRLTLHQEISKQLIEANQGAANVEAKTFDFDLSRITTNDKQVFVTVKSTFPEGDKPGLNSGTVTVNLTLIPLNQDQVLPNEAHVQLTLNETHKTEKLTDNDKTLLHDAAIAALNKANQNANVEKETFELDLSEITPETEILKVKVNPTDSTADKPGLISTEELNVHLQLTATFSEAIDPVGSEIQQLQLNSTFKNNQLKEDDQTLLRTEITEKLKAANQGANLENVTFVMDLTNLTPESEEVTVKVNATASTPDLPGLKAKQVEVNLDLIPANLDKVNAKEARVTFDLTDSKKEEELSENDKELLHDEIINQLKVANPGTVILENTFEVNLDGVTPERAKLIVKVNGTDSTADLKGLNEGEVNVLLALNLPKLEKVEAKTTSVEFNLTQTQKENILTSDDQRILHQEIINQLMAANADAVVSNGTFEFNLTEITPESSSVHVVVKETNSTPDKPGLKSGEIDVDLTLHAAPKDQVQPKDAIVNLELTETRYGDVLTEVDQALLRQEIIKSLTEANQGAIIDENTFEFDVTKIVAGDTSDMTVHVHATESTVDNPGLKEGTARVQLLLIPVWE